MKWLEEERIDSSMAYDLAKDTFRRRTAVKGFRVGLLCHACWATVGKRERDVIRKFVIWFMNRDLEESLKMFGKRYNELQSQVGCDNSVHHNNLYKDLPDTFTKNELVAMCLQKNIKSKVRQILWRWREDKAITEVKKDVYKKCQKQ
jgi:hypothetical protein